uniref:MICOS complex subunit n=1 Tax=Oncorhynchus tshawytscha TaxID=74940 RepID=A0A8C8IXS7_ONCTS
VYLFQNVAGVAAVPVTLSLMSGTVFAATEDKPNVTSNTNELSLYTTPQQKFHYVEPDIGHLEPGVTTLRKLAEPYVTWCQGAIVKVKPKVESAIQLGSGKKTHALLWSPLVCLLAAASIAKVKHSLYDFTLQGYTIIDILSPPPHQ